MSKIADRSAVVCVVGLGYVGLPFAVEKAKVGFRVVGIDQNPTRATAINEGRNYITDVNDDELHELVTTGLITARTNFDAIPDADVIVIAVPTPLTKNLAPDLRYIENVAKAITPHLRPGQLVSLESTTYPGTTDEVLLPLLTTTHLQAGTDFFLCHSPERVDPGNKRYSTKNTTKVVGGIDPESLRVAEFFYQQTIDTVVPVSSARAAELVKVFENTYRAVNIALVNELAMLCDRMNLDVWEVLRAAFTKPFGIQPFFPGPGVGGHCIPLDPHYLEWKAREYNFTTRFVALAGEINRRMPEFVKDKALRLLGRAGIATRGANILVLGVAYKRDIDDARESPAMDIIELLLTEGAHVTYHDTHVPTVTINGHTLTSTPLTTTTLNNTDLVIIATDHTNIDYTHICTHAPRVFDTRGTTTTITNPNAEVTRL